ncbi:MAG: hypothetical protein LBJ22_03365 [Synergistaceae bacterium]|jgi:hypothetical protein|nr:hypothetical protein [Synergistaceae bacterium]
MEVKNAPTQKVTDAFHLMWDNFPEPVTLVHKSREVAAGNKENEHFREPGTICARTGVKGSHAGCRANEALASGKAVTAPHYSSLEDKYMITYWVPLDGYPDYYVHFSIRFQLGSDDKTITMAPMTDEHKKIMGVRWDL